MHYYTFNIGDYRKDSGHLSNLEHGIYRQLIDWYLLDEKPIPKETQMVIRRLRLDTDADKKALQNVLADFFVLEEDGYHQGRCDVAIRDYHERAGKNKENGKLGGRPKKTQSVISDNPNESESKGNQEPITNNQEPVLKTKKAAPSSPFSLPDWISNDSFEAFIEHRKKLKAPMTHLAQTRLVAELSRLREDGNEPHAVLDQSILNGWKGVFPLKQQAGAPVGSKAARQQQDKEWLDELTGRTKHAIIDITPT